MLTTENIRADYRASPKYCPGMSKINALVLENALAKKGWSNEEASLRAGRSKSYVSDLLSGRSKNPRSGSLRSLAQVLEVPISNLLEDDVQGPSPTVADVTPNFRSGGYPMNVPIYGQVNAAHQDRTAIDFDEPIGMAPRPPRYSNNRSIYVVYVAGTSMQPKYDPGRKIYVDPRRPPANGDDVIVQLTDGDVANPQFSHGIVKNLLRQRDQSVILQQYNPVEEFEVKRQHIKDMHYVCTIEDLFGV
ncbi:MAG: LexA family transcriptional regulator [Pseudomonadota bacterium]